MADIVYMSKKAWVALLDAIRAKSGHSGTLTASDAKTAVDSIETGSSAPSYDYPLAALERTKSVPTIDPSVTRIAPYVFRGYSELTSISLPDTVVEIGENAFNSCKKLALSTLPASLKTVGYGALSSTPITVSELPDGLTSIGDYAFSGCTKLALSTLPASLKTMGKSAFSGSSVTISEVPEGVTEISDMCFMQCNDIESVVIPAHVTSVGFMVWTGCPGVKSVTVNAAVDLGSNSFDGCTSLSKIIINARASISGDTFAATAETGAMVIRYADGIVQLTSELNPQYYPTPSYRIGTSEFPVYVPDALVSGYKTATNWEKIADYIKPLSAYTEA